jgi:hypothetical protein
MSQITPVQCPVSRAEVVRVTDLEGSTVRVICCEYDEATRTCHLKARAGQAGPLGRLLERAAEGTLAAHGVRCELA